MTPEDFKAWRDEMGFTQQEAADALGLSRPSVVNYEAGRRREDDRPVSIPLSIALACAALAIGLPPWESSGNHEPVITPAEAYEAGRMAIIDKTGEDNPFDLGSDLHEQWNSGWSDEADIHNRG